MSPKFLNTRDCVQYVLPRPQPIIIPSEYPDRGGAKEGTIRKLPYDVLLKIFHYYFDDSPQFWPRLVHICHKWRRIVFASHRALHLRLFCTHRTPVLKALDCWPTLPIVVQYGGPPAPYSPAPEDEDNDIVAALKHSGRISSISLTVTKTLLEKLSEIEGPFSELEHLVLRCRDSVPLILSDSFQCGPRLRTMCLTSVSIPSLPRLLYHSTGLIDLQLHGISDAGHISPEAFADALSAMTHLRTLSLHFFPCVIYLSYAGLSLLRKRVILPALMRLKYRGTSSYLDSLAAAIDAPGLSDMDIRLIDKPPQTRMNSSYRIIGRQPQMDSEIWAPQLGLFINRIGMQQSHRRADILFSEHAASISITQPESSTRLKLQVSYKTLSQQLSHMARMHNGLYSFLLGVEQLYICAKQAELPTSGYDNSDCKDWQKLLRLFGGTKWAHLPFCYWPNVIDALKYSEAQRETLLPSLRKVCIQGPDPHDMRSLKAGESFIYSRLLSGHIIALEYEPLWINELHGTAGPSCQRVTTEMLSADLLLNIFCRYLQPSPQIWPTLTHVCRRWRQIVLSYPLCLDLRLYCTYGMPVSKILECWPHIPLVVNYGGIPELGSPALEDDDNIIDSLKESDRVSSINLTVTSSLIEKLPAITKPFSELEELVLLSQDNVQLTLPSAFRWGSRLRTLHSTRVAFPSTPHWQLLSPCQDLVDIQLHKIPSTGYFPPEALANALSGVTHLRIFSLHFLSFPPRRKHLGLPPRPEGRAVLPALRRLKYRGTSKYLDSFVARIDAPRLRDIDITFFSQPTMDASQLGRFIERIEMQRPLSRADVRIFLKAISISFHNQSIASPIRLQLEIPCEQLDWQLSSMAQICNQFSSFLFHVKDLHICSIQSPNREDDIASLSEQWLELIRAFGSAQEFGITGVHVTDILRALRAANGGHTTETVLPSTLLILRVWEHMTVDMPLWKAAESLLASWRLTGSPVRLYAELKCHICYTRFIWQQELKRHLVAMHSYRVYYGDSECKPGFNDLFSDQQLRRYAEIAQTDSHISNPEPSGSSSHGNGIPALDIFGPFTTLKAPLGLSGLPFDTSEMSTTT